MIKKQKKTEGGNEKGRREPAFTVGGIAIHPAVVPCLINTLRPQKGKKTKTP